LSTGDKVLQTPFPQKAATRLRKRGKEEDGEGFRREMWIGNAPGQVQKKKKEKKKKKEGKEGKKKGSRPINAWKK